ncbi:hypothetical protein SASPL_105277 [Salvia splendens]|uniref:GOLD domain-containing protein n=1 Tax=Salvia splendens TaxID=180675 RepID=A0A8X9A964_SALSN|nr:hypothetical protein SASPL_105277 [Salvia splendens]
MQTDIGERLLIQEAESEPPHKVDENMLKNRIEEIVYLLEPPRWPRALQEQGTVEDHELASLLPRIRDKFKSTLGTLEAFQARYSDFGDYNQQQKEQSERNKQAAVDALITSGGSIRDIYALLWKQQMESFLKIPFFITAEDAGALAARKHDDYKDMSVSAGETHEVTLTVESMNSYIAWDFSVVQGKLSQGNFCTCVSGDYKLIWDNSISQVIRYKVDCIPPVVPAADQ